MQVTSINHKNQPLASVRSHSQINTYNRTKKSLVQCLYALYAYFLAIPVIALPIKIGKLFLSMFSCIISVFTGKPLPKQQPKAALSPVLVTEERSHPPASEYVPEAQIKDHFLVMASHELKTPMTTILGQAQLMLRRLEKMPELSTDLLIVRAGLESINDQTHRLNTMVDDLLDLYSIRAGKLQLHLVPSDLVNMCRDVVTELSLLTGRTIELVTPLEAITLQADSDRLHQVIVNLVGNAIKYSSADTPVKILVDQRHDLGIIEVTDNGIGIPEDQQTRIFEPFYRSPDVQTTSTSGMGLGLSICKDIIERHGGRISCRSRVGKGSTFIIELPLHKRA